MVRMTGVSVTLNQQIGLYDVSSCRVTLAGECHIRVLVTCPTTAHIIKVNNKGRSIASFIARTHKAFKAASPEFSTMCPTLT
jgi:hypothetical protein